MPIACHSDRLKKVIRIVLDSGLMYTISVVIFLATTLGRSNAQYGVSDVVVQVIVSNFVFQGDFRMKHRSLIGHCQGITFNLIIVRVDAARGSTASVLQPTIFPSTEGTCGVRNIDTLSPGTPVFNIRDGKSELDVTADVAGLPYSDDHSDHKPRRNGCEEV